MISAEYGEIKRGMPEMHEAEVLYAGSGLAGQAAEDSTPNQIQKPDIDDKYSHMFPPYGVHVPGVPRDKYGFRTSLDTKTER